VNTIQRLETFRLKKGWSWDQLGEALGLKRTMLHYVRSGERELSDKALYRLSQAEWAAGIAPPPVTHSVSSEAAEHLISSRVMQKKGIAKLRGQVQKLQTQIAAITTTLNEMEK